LGTKGKANNKIRDKKLWNWIPFREFSPTPTHLKEYYYYYYYHYYYCRTYYVDLFRTSKSIITQVPSLVQQQGAYYLISEFFFHLCAAINKSINYNSALY